MVFPVAVQVCIAQAWITINVVKTSRRDVIWMVHPESTIHVIGGEQITGISILRFLPFGISIFPTLIYVISTT